MGCGRKKERKKERKREGRKKKEGKKKERKKERKREKDRFGSSQVMDFYACFLKSSYSVLT